MYDTAYARGLYPLLFQLVEYAVYAVGVARVVAGDDDVAAAVLFQGFEGVIFNVHCDYGADTGVDAGDELLGGGSAAMVERILPA